jgi:DNA polymerase-3 subunit alpha
MTQMPVLDTCTEVTASLLIPGGRGGKFKLPTLTELHQYLSTTTILDAQMQLPTLKQQHDVSIIRTEILPKKNLM